MSDRRQSAVGELRQQTEAALALVAALYPILENDDVLRRDMVEGSTDLHEALRSAVARIIEIEALRVGIQQTIKVMKDRLAAYDGQEERLRAAMLAAMEAGGLQRLETALGTVSRKAVAPSVVITDELLVPAGFWKRGDPKLDKRALLDALKALPPGEHIPGATLSNGGTTIQIRS